MNRVGAEASGKAARPQSSFLQDRNLKIISSPSQDELSAKEVTKAVEAAMTRTDWVGNLFSRAFEIS